MNPLITDQQRDFMMDMAESQGFIGLNQIEESLRPGEVPEEIRAYFPNAIEQGSFFSKDEFRAMLTELGVY